jgi:hypothetical protein
MKHWTLHTILVETYPVKVYVNHNNTIAVVFPLYGRYYRLRSDVNALDLTCSMLFHKTVDDISYNTISYSSYLNSLEDTVSIDLEHVA